MDDAQSAATRTTAPQPSALQAILPHILRTFRREPALALTVAYLFVALAGIYYDYSFYQVGFGIPILTLSQIGDFLVAGLQQPVALLLMVAAFVFLWLADKYNALKRREQIAKLAELRALPQRSWWQECLRRLLEWKVGALWFTQVMYVMILAAFGWWMVGWYAANRVDAVKRGDGARVAIHLVGEPGGLPTTDPKGWGYLGAVSSYVFVYDPIAGRALVLPVNAIQTIQPASVKGKPGLLVPVVHLP